MTKLFFALAIIAAGLVAQPPLRTVFPFGGATAVGPNGHVWILGADRVARFDAAGRNVFTTPIATKFGSGSLAVDATGRAAIATHDTLILLDPQGSIVRTQQLDVFPAAVTIDAKGNIFLAGVARDGFIGPPGVYKPSFGEKACGGGRTDYYFCSDAFVAKYLPDGTRAWVTLFGGSFNDYASAIALDPSGAIWIAGETISPNMPVTADALQPAYGGGEFLGPNSYGDAFLARIDPTGSHLEYATYLGGSRFDRATGLAASSAGVIVIGMTESPNFTTTPNAFRRSLASSKMDMPGSHTDTFVALVSTAGALVYSTLFGEPGPDFASASASGFGNEFAIAAVGSTRHCLLRMEVRDTVNKFAPDCFRAEYAAPRALLFARGEWLAIGSTKPGIQLPGAPPQRSYTTVYKFGSASANPVVVGVWNEFYPRFRPILAADSFISIYGANLSSARVRLGDRDLKILYSGKTQINTYVPPDAPMGLFDLTVGDGQPTPVDVVERWPGIAGALLNQDGTVNSADNPADRGTIVSLFGSGFGPEILQPVRLSIEPGFPAVGENIELLSAGRIADGLFQFNVRIPRNARAGHTALQIRFPMPADSSISFLVRVHLR